jgi:glutamine cyclotransferase
MSSFIFQFKGRVAITVFVLTSSMGWGCNNNGNSDQPAEEGDVPAAISYQIVKEYPHDPKAFTQGLEWRNGQLVEGTGQFGESNVRMVDLASGAVKKEVKNKEEIFGEGVTVLNGKLYQLTWQNRLGYVYDAATLKLEKEFSFNTEGWGITNNGKELIYSDGSSNLYFLDPATLKETHRIGVYDNNGPQGNLNELEYIKGFVYANKWQTGYILKIDPSSGKVVARADLSDLRGKSGIDIANPNADVLNGIAYDSATNRIFVTGKYWPKLFEVKLDN